MDRSDSHLIRWSKLILLFLSRFVLILRFLNYNIRVEVRIGTMGLDKKYLILIFGFFHY